MIKVDIGSSDKKKWSGISIQGMQFAIVLQHTTNNTAFAANPVDLAQIKVQLTLFKKRSGRTHEIFNDSLLPLILHSGFFTGGFQQNLQIGTFVSNVLVAASAGIDEVIQINGKIQLDSVINAIEPGDELNFSIQNPAGAYGATVDPAVSFFYYDIIEGVGLGDAVPTIYCQAVPPASSNDKFSGGEGVKSLSFINTDKAGVTNANAVIVNLSLQGDKLGDMDDYADILSKRNNMFEDVAQSNVRNQCFRIYDERLANLSGMPVRLNRVDLSITYNAANVVAGKNWYVVSRMVNDSAVYALYASKLNGQREQNILAPAMM